MHLTSFRFSSYRLLISSLLLCAGGCAQLSAPPAMTEAQSPTTSKQLPGETLQASKKDNIENASFNSDTLYSLLVAEVAGHRGRADVALTQYLKQAQVTRDPKIIARANRIARYMGAQKEALETSLLWIEVEPDSIEAHQVAAQQFIFFGRYTEALQQIDILLTLSDEINLDPLVKSSAKLDATQRQKLIQDIAALAKKHKDNTPLLLAQGVLLELNLQNDEALVVFNQILQIKPDSIPAIIAKARLLLKTKQTEPAKDLLAKAVKSHPDHVQLQLFYAQLLIKTGKIKQAEKQLKILEKKSEGDEQLLLLIATLYLENNLTGQASAYLERLMDSEDFSNEAHFYQALIDERNQKFDSALEHLEQVKPSQNFVEARIRIASILDKMNKPKEALLSLANDRKNFPQLSPILFLAESELLCGRKQYQACYSLLEVALKTHPDNAQILYAKAMAAEKINRFDMMEQDLLTLINKNPKNAAALNALGYSLADRTQRFDEALTYITRAYALSPKDAAIIDSLGWVHYRLGNHKEALKYLKVAYEMTADHEIAAHLGEVLWVTGQHEEAKKIWQKALKSNPQSPYIQSVMKRFPG